MPELPEVEVIRRGLEGRLQGRKIVDVRFPPESGKSVPVVKNLSPQHFRDAVHRRTIKEVTRRGKYLALHLDSGALLVVHLRMTGSLLFPEAPEDRFVRAVFVFEPELEMRFSDVRKFGGVWLVESMEEVTAAIGPEPIGPEFTPAVLEQVLKGRRSPVKSVILDQRRIAGIGNIYADEACFGAGIDPRRLAETITEAESHELHASIRTALEAGMNHGGASFRDYRNTGGRVGSMQDHVKVFRRTGLPCYTCGTVIQRTKVGGRSTHFCPACQS